MKNDKRFSVVRKQIASTASWIYSLLGMQAVFTTGGVRKPVGGRRRK